MALTPLPTCSVKCQGPLAHADPETPQDPWFLLVRGLAVGMPHTTRRTWAGAEKAQCREAGGALSMDSAGAAPMS